MKEKPSITHYKPADLREFIQKYRINQPMLCVAIGMNENVFKNKLYQSHPSYFFSEEEYTYIVAALSMMSNEIGRMMRRTAPSGILNSARLNIGKNIEKFRATPFLKSHEI